MQKTDTNYKSSILTFVSNTCDFGVDSNYVNSLGSVGAISIGQHIYN